MAIQAPKGTTDLLPRESRIWDHFKRTAFGVFSRYGYEPIETPIFEQTELFVRGIGEATDVVSKEMFSTITGENLKTLLGGGHVKSNSRFSLRPEGTASVVRAVAQHNLVTPGGVPAKLMYAGPMFRAENVQKGRQRQFNQVGIECLGSVDPAIDAEAIIMLMRFYHKIGLKPETLRLLINSMGCEKCRPAYRDAVAHFLLDHESELCEECVSRAHTNPLRAFDCKKENCREVMKNAPLIIDALCEECKDHYAAVKGYLDEAGIAYIEDPTLVRGLDYYTRTVFEVQVVEGMGAQNAIGGGGRYDKLMEEVGGNPTPGLGFALGFERCILALEAQGFQFDEARVLECYVACVDPAVKPQAFMLVQRLRDAGFATDMDHQGKSLKAQFKVAGKQHVPYVFVLGPDELAAGSVTCRNMDAHDEVTLNLEKLTKALEQAALTDEPTALGDVITQSS
ncbi:histidine--tRNA ligase [Anaerotardibacter muris]|uniref:histidine--tRNA ligase n=1 Tax=Anaerotardibacter muris TaxID=2941505 RepID=UPI002040F79B|nr:histidine--tRNA ligase [Anaerotardibacter muris]